MRTWCRATLNYTGTPIEVDIHDGRATDLPGWRECGFERVDHSSAVQDWTDDVEIASVHYAEAEDLARELTGLPHTLVADHVKRSAEEAKRAREQHPVRLVHSDFADSYADVVRNNYRNVKGRGATALARAGITGEDVAGARRIVMLQLWRNLGVPRMNLPVAWCDARTLTRDEMQPFRYDGYVAGADQFDALAITPPEVPDRHRWYAFPELTADEAVAFRTFDTDMLATGGIYFTPHSAFEDRTATAPRFSIELRVMCLEL
jgi:hypothetical protein